MSYISHLIQYNDLFCPFDLKSNTNTFSPKSMIKKEATNPMVPDSTSGSIEKPSVNLEDKKFHKLLRRQIKRKLGKDAQLSKDMMELLSSISDSYDHFERDREMIERSLDLSSKELRESYGKLAVQSELKRTNSELQQFVSIASHDLKAPLRTINSFVQLLERKLKGQLDESAQEYMQFIKSGVLGMDELIQNLLQHAKASSNKGKVEPVKLNDIVSIVNRNLFSLIEDTNAEVIIESELPIINSVSFQMIQLFQNIIGNGIKFKREDVNPIIRIHYKEEGENLLFCIADNGIGISKENTAKVFEVFQRLAGANKYEGTGLGLSICKKIIENLNGKIWVESEVGKGTSFFFTIPKELAVDNEQQILYQKMIAGFNRILKFPLEIFSKSRREILFNLVIESM